MHTYNIKYAQIKKKHTSPYAFTNTMWKEIIIIRKLGPKGLNCHWDHGDIQVRAAA